MEGGSGGGGDPANLSFAPDIPHGRDKDRSPVAHQARTETRDPLSSAKLDPIQDGTKEGCYLQNPLLGQGNLEVKLPTKNKLILPARDPDSVGG